MVAQGTSKARPAAQSAKQTPSSSSKPTATPTAPFSMGSGFANLACKYDSCSDPCVVFIYLLLNLELSLIPRFSGFCGRNQPSVLVPLADFNLA